MSDLCVDYARLQVIEHDLGIVKREFESCEEHQERLRGIYGSGTVADAMEDFTTNWDRHRKEVLESVKSVGEMASNVHQSFLKTDKKLEQECKGE